MAATITATNHGSTFEIHGISEFKGMVFPAPNGDLFKYIENLLVLNGHARNVTDIEPVFNDWPIAGIQSNLKITYNTATE